jgi:hypothetical protein
MYVLFDMLIVLFIMGATMSIKTKIATTYTSETRLVTPVPTPNMVLRKVLVEPNSVSIVRSLTDF